jgi:ribose transport system substrate-binding protein
MKRALALTAILTAILIAAFGAGSTTSAASVTGSQAPCPAGKKLALIGATKKCVGLNVPCQTKFARSYVKVGFACTAGRLTYTAAGAAAFAAAKIQKAYKGLYRTPPTAGPRAQKGKNVYAISCGFVAIGCQVPTEQVAVAGKSLGWNVTLVDGKLNPADYSAAINQAIAAKADGIVTVGLDCSSALAAYQAAKSANIPVIGVFEFDCNDPKVGGQKLMTAQIDTGTGQNPGKWFYNWGVLHADYIIAKTHGKARVIELAQVPFLDVYYEDKGFEAEMKKCHTCSIVVRQEITAADLGGTGGAQKVGSAIQAHPDANSIYFDNDTLLGESATTLQSNPHPGWVIVGSEGFPNTLALVRSGVVTALVGIPSPWLGWCAAQGLNQIFAKKSVTDCGADFEIIDKTHNLPASGQPWIPKVDFQAAMKKAWLGS